MKIKSLLLSLLLISSISLFSQATEAKGLITFKTIKITNPEKKLTDTITEVGKYTMVTLFNKVDSKLITISDSSGYYYFRLDEEIANFTHVQFYNDYGVYVAFPIAEIKQPFHDVLLVKDETIQEIKELDLVSSEEEPSQIDLEIEEASKEVEDVKIEVKEEEE